MEKLHKCKPKKIQINNLTSASTREIARGMYEQNKGSFEVIRYIYDKMELTEPSCIQY
jgi:hypothetical protein